MKIINHIVRQQQIVLLVSTSLIAVCGLVYELLAGTLSSYLLGDSVYQFSLVIGLFMSSMGLGAWLSRYLESSLVLRFVQLQLLVGLLGGFAAPLLFFAFAVINNYTPILFIIVVVLGSLLGIEIPLVIRILKAYFNLKFNVSNVFTADYIGALIAALLFPLVLVPQLGLLQTGFLFGLLNVIVAGVTSFVFWQTLSHKVLLVSTIVFATGSLLFGFFYASNYTSAMEKQLYQDSVVYAKHTPFQRLVITKRGERVRFFINGALQFDSADEYRYHESLVHPVMQQLDKAEHILVLGGGDGLVVRELLKYPHIKEITLVDLDPAVTELFKRNKLLATLNQGALSDVKVTIINQDAWRYLQKNRLLFDAIIIDLPDPNNPSLSRLYSATFYRLVKQHLSQQGILVTQATSPLYAREAFWCIADTLASVTTANESWTVLPYHTYVPSFGEWGFVMASRRQLSAKIISHSITRYPMQYRYLSRAILMNSFDFPSDMESLPVSINQLISHSLLDYYKKGWEQWYYPKK